MNNIRLSSLFSDLLVSMFFQERTFDLFRICLWITVIESYLLYRKWSQGKY
jgi:hypothetical protein